MTTEPLDCLPISLLLLVICTLPKFDFHAKLGLSVFSCVSVPIDVFLLFSSPETLVGRKGEALDGCPFIIGLSTLLRQFHISNTQIFLSFLGQFARFTVAVSGYDGHLCFFGLVNFSLIFFSGFSDSLPSQLPSDLQLLLIFLDQFCHFASIDRSQLAALLPAFLLDKFMNSSARPS